MRSAPLFILAATLFLAGCVSSGLPRPMLRYDDKDRLVERKQYDRSGRLLSETTYTYPDPSIRVERSTDYALDGGRTEAEIYHVWDTPVSFKSIKEYSADGGLLEERTYLLPVQRGTVEVIEGWTPDPEPQKN